MKISDKFTLQELNINNLFKVVSYIDIYKKYMNVLVFDKVFSSPFREDKNPSFIISSKTGLYKDFATGEWGNCIQFVKKLYNINYNEALQQIAKDFNLESNFVTSSSSTKRKIKKASVKNCNTRKTISGQFTLTIKKRKLNHKDISYWKEYGVDVTNKYLGIIPISHYFLNNTPFKAEEYAYAYLEKKDEKVTFKIYQPFSKYKKWINNNDYSTWELWNLLPKTGENLIITSSRKDAAAIIQNMNIPSTSLQAESIIPKESVMRELQNRFKNVYLLYDNDLNKEKNWGQENALKLTTRFPFLKNIKIPDSLNSKDFSDLIYDYKPNFATKILKELL